MKIKRKLIASMDISAFADLHDLTMFIGERARNDKSKFYARFEDAEVKGDGVLSSVFGNGATEDDAISEYAQKISLSRLVICAGGPYRREIDVPRLTYNAPEEA